MIVCKFLSTIRIAWSILYKNFHSFRPLCIAKQVYLTICVMFVEWHSMRYVHYQRLYYVLTGIIYYFKIGVYAHPQHEAKARPGWVQHMCRVYHIDRSFPSNFWKIQTNFSLFLVFLRSISVIKISILNAYVWIYEYVFFLNQDIIEK